MLSKSNLKRNTSLNIKEKLLLNNKHQETDNLLELLEEEPQKPEVFPQKIKEIPEENRRSSCKIIDKSGIVRSFGEEKTGFSSYISLKNTHNNSLRNNDSNSVMNSMKNSENLPMNSLLLDVFPSARYIKPSLDFISKNNEKSEYLEQSKKNEFEFKEPNFKGNSVVFSKRNSNFFKGDSSVKNSGICKEEFEKINEKFTENLMKEIMDEKKSEEKVNKNLKKTMIIRGKDRELTAFVDNLQKSRENIEAIQKIPSKRDVFEEKKKDIKPKIGIFEADFINIDEKTKINEKLLPSNFDKRLLDEDLINSSNIAMDLKENVKNSSKKSKEFEKNNNKNNSQFLEFFQVGKRENYSKMEKKDGEKVKK